MIVGRLGRSRLGDKSIVIIDLAGRIGVMFWNVRDIIDNVPYEICRPAVQSLGTEGVARCVHANVAQDANVVHRTIRLNAVVMNVRDQVIVNIGRNESLVFSENFLQRIHIRVAERRIAVRNSVRCMIYSVVKIGHIVMAYDMTGSGDFNGIFGKAFFIRVWRG